MMPWFGVFPASVFQNQLAALSLLMLLRLVPAHPRTTSPLSLWRMLRPSPEFIYFLGVSLEFWKWDSTTKHYGIQLCLLFTLSVYLGLVHGSVSQWLRKKCHLFYCLLCDFHRSSLPCMALVSLWVSEEHPWPSMNPCGCPEPFPFTVSYQGQYKPAFSSLNLNLKIWRGKYWTHKGLEARASIWWGFSIWLWGWSSLC